MPQIVEAEQFPFGVAEAEPVSDHLHPSERVPLRLRPARPGLEHERLSRIKRSIMLAACQQALDAGDFALAETAWVEATVSHLTDPFVRGVHDHPTEGSPTTEAHAPPPRPLGDASE